jgi:hypothetical protein
MATNFPTSLDTFNNPIPGVTKQNDLAFVHTEQHANANDAIEAIQAKLGIGASTPTAGAFLKGDGTGSSKWLAQRVFSYVRSASVSNVTGNGTVYTCPFDAAVVSSGNYSGGVFTAPEAGLYLFTAHVSCVPSSSGVTQGVVQLVTTDQSLRFDFNPWAIRHSASGVASVSIHGILPLDAGETAKITLTLTGAGSDNCSFVGGNGFSGFSAIRLG